MSKRSKWTGQREQIPPKLLGREEIYCPRTHDRDLDVNIWRVPLQQVIIDPCYDGRYPCSCVKADGELDHIKSRVQVWVLERERLETQMLRFPILVLHRDGMRAFERPHFL